MSDKYNDLIESPDTQSHIKYYLGYQYRFGRNFIVPYLEKAKVFSEGSLIAEIGSAEAGVLAALKLAGAGYALATDINTQRLEYGKEIATKAGIDIDFVEHNILLDDIPKNWIEQFDLVILRDVIEHLDDTSLALERIEKLIKPGGFLYLTFPPYHSPFGGHQHTVANLAGKVPYTHLLPNFLFYPFLYGGRANDQGEVKRLQSIKLTPKKLIKAALQTGYSIFLEDYYILRPVFKEKFGLPSLRLGGFARISFVKNYLCLEASFILQKRK